MTLQGSQKQLQFQLTYHVFLLRCRCTGWQPEKLNPRAAPLAYGPHSAMALQGSQKQPQFQLTHLVFLLRCRRAGWQPEKLNPRAASLADGPITAKALQGAALAIFGNPTRQFMPKEIAALHAYVDQVGGPLKTARHSITVHGKDAAGRGGRNSHAAVHAQQDAHIRRPGRGTVLVHLW